MKVYELPDGKLVVPARAEGDGVIGDGMAVIGKDGPEYQKWRDWLERSGEKAVQVPSWPPLGGSD